MTEFQSPDTVSFEVCFKIQSSDNKYVIANDYHRDDNILIVLRPGGLKSYFNLLAYDEVQISEYKEI